jgi:hypothetical protein
LRQVHEAVIDPVLNFDLASAVTATRSAERIVACAREHGRRLQRGSSANRHANS